MPRAIWSGAIVFGLVNVPVRMYSAIDEQDIHFHLVHEKDGSRIGYEKVCKKEGKPVPDDEIVKAYESGKGKHVYMTDEDFEAAAVEGYKTIDISDFVPRDEIDPIYFERTYYLGPQEGAEKVYALLRRAMDEAGLAGIAKYVMRERQHLGALRVYDGVIALEKMFFADEIRPSDDIAPGNVRVGQERARHGPPADRSLLGDVQAREVRRHLPRAAARDHRRQAQGQGRARRAHPEGGGAR